MKIVIKLILLLGVLGYLIFAIFTLSGDDDSRICRSTKIIIEENTDTGFVDTTFIEQLLKQTKKPTTGIPLRSIEINYIQEFIRKCPYLDSVICYYTPNNVMCIRVIPRKPVLHVISDNGDSYYMDVHGNDMPTNIFALNLCLATGNISKEFAKENLINIAVFLNSHKPWGKEIQQIHVKNPHHLELIPMTGDHVIILGEPTDIESKMNKLSTFYREGLDKTGWNKYKTIDLNYANQVVCTRRKQ